MELLRKLRNYYFYCGIEKEEYNELKKGAYISYFEVWNILHYLMSAVFAVLFAFSLSNGIMQQNRLYYLGTFLYSVAALGLFRVLKKDSIAAQLLIYLSMSVLFLFGCFISLNTPEHNATTFIALLLITPMFMIDKPFFMTIELTAASAVFLTWMYGVKSYEIWQIDFVNVITFTIVGCFLNVIANAIRIKEFVLTRTIQIQKDTDEMTGLRNKGALTREINAYLADKNSDKGLLFMLDVDRFKTINDTYGHDIGDSVIIQLGHYLNECFDETDITGRFGGDEFIVFLKGSNDYDSACGIAQRIVTGASRRVVLPNPAQTISISAGVAIYNGVEQNYSEIFKKADVALYQAKADLHQRYCVYQAKPEQ